MADYDADVVVVGAGGFGAVVALKSALAGKSVIMLEAGPEMPYWKVVENWRSSPRKDIFAAPYDNTPRAPNRCSKGYFNTDTDVKRWPGTARVIGGTSCHGTAITWRFLPDDFKIRSTFGVGCNWPITDDDLEPFHTEAEYFLGVSGFDGDDQSGSHAGQAYPSRSKPYPLPPEAKPCIVQRMQMRLADKGLRIIHAPSARASRTYDGRPACIGNNLCQPECPIRAKFSGIMAVDRARAAGVQLRSDEPLWSRRGQYGHGTMVQRRDLPDREKIPAFTMALWNQNYTTQLPDLLIREKKTIGSALDGGIRDRVSKIFLNLVLSEDLPEKANGITLNTNWKDSLGLPGLKYTSKVSDYSRAMLPRILNDNAVIAQAMGVKESSINEYWICHDHLMGTVMMGGDAATSVVDPQCSRRCPEELSQDRQIQIQHRRGRHGRGRAAQPFKSVGRRPRRDRRLSQNIAPRPDRSEYAGDRSHAAQPHPRRADCHQRDGRRFNDNRRGGTLPVGLCVVPWRERRTSEWRPPQPGNVAQTVTHGINLGALDTTSPMPASRLCMTGAQIAAVATYVRQRFGGHTDTISGADAAKIGAGTVGVSWLTANARPLAWTGLAVAGAVLMPGVLWFARRKGTRAAQTSRSHGDVDRHAKRETSTGGHMSQNVSEVLIEVLESAGVKRCYGIVGDTMNHFAHAMRNSSIRFVHMRHEEAGAFAAGVESQLTHGLTACAGSCGPGGLHFINGLFEANRNRVPVILIATQLVRRDLGFDAVQEVDFKEVYGSCSVYCEMILTPDQARRKMVAACQAALVKRGVAVVVLPADIAMAAAAPELPYAVQVSDPLVRPNDSELGEIAEILNSSSKITIYAGAGCEGATKELVAVAEKLKAPVAHTSRGKDFAELDNPYNVGMTGLIGEPPGYRAVLDCDVLLQLGADFAWPQFYPSKARIIQIDIEPTHIGRRHPVAKGAVGNIRATLEALSPLLHPHTDSKFLQTHVDQYKALRAEEATEAPSDPNGTIPGSWLAKLVNKHAGDDAIFVADDGTPLAWMLRHVEIRGGRRTLGSLLHGTMASGMSSAIGAQACQPGRQVVVLAGDGGFSMLMGDLLTTVQENVPIKIVVFNNGKLGFVDIEQKASGLIPVYTDLQNPDFGKLASAVGIWGRSVSRAGDLEAAIKEWLAQTTPALLDVRVAPMQLIAPPSPFVSAEALVGMASYSIKAILQGKGGDVWQMITESER